MRRFALVIAMATWASSVAAAPKEAEVLFERGRSLMAGGRHAEACPLLARSQEIDPAEGTLLALGLCHERIDANVQAYDELSAALESATESGRDDRQRVARTALSRVNAKVGHITVRLAPDSDGLELRRDGKPFPRRLLGHDIALEPGGHSFELRRKDHVIWEVMITVVAGAASELTVPVPTSKDEPERAPLVATPAPPSPEPRRSRWRFPPWLGYALGGVGLSTLSVGSVFGIRAFSKWSDVEGRCDKLPNCADTQARADAASASSSATAANVLVGTGLILIGAAAFVLLTDRPSAPPRSPAELSAGR